MDIFKIAFAIIGAIIGAGFASGQEINLFFFSYGEKGILGIIISSIFIGIIINKVFKIAIKNNVNNYNDFLSCLIKNQKIKKIINCLINAFILISFYIMVAGFGAYLSQELNFNYLIGSGILAFLCFLSFRKDIDGFLKLNEILIPILICFIFIIRNNKYKNYKYIKF